MLLGLFMTTFVKILEDFGDIDTSDKLGVCSSRSTKSRPVEGNVIIICGDFFSISEAQYKHNEEKREI